VSSSVSHDLVGQVPLRYPAREPACESARELDSVMEFGLFHCRICTTKVGSIAERFRPCVQDIPTCCHRPQTLLWTPWLSTIQSR